MRRLLLVVAVLLATWTAGNTVYADPPLPLRSMPICGDQDGSESPFVLNCSDLIPSPNVQTYQVPGGGTIDVQFDFPFRGALFNNELGFFKVDSPSGVVEGLNPGDPGYLASALKRATIIFPSGSDAFTPDVRLQVNSGDILAFFLIQNGTLANVLANNPNNELNKIPLTFFSLDALNPDGVDHFVGFENTVNKYSQFGFEDLTGGGDLDYDDVVYNIAPPLQPLTSPERKVIFVQGLGSAADCPDGFANRLEWLTQSEGGLNTLRTLEGATIGSDDFFFFSYSGKYRDCSTGKDISLGSGVPVYTLEDSCDFEHEGIDGTFYPRLRELVRTVAPEGSNVKVDLIRFCCKNRRGLGEGLLEPWIRRVRQPAQTGC